MARSETPASTINTLRFHFKIYSVLALQGGFIRLRTDRCFHASNRFASGVLTALQALRVAPEIVILGEFFLRNVYPNLPPPCQSMLA